MRSGRAGRRFASTLGWFTAEYRGVRLIYHNGANPGFRAAIVLVPSTKAGVVLLANSDSSQFTSAATLNDPVDR